MTREAQIKMFEQQRDWLVAEAFDAYMHNDVARRDELDRRVQQLLRELDRFQKNDCGAN